MSCKAGQGQANAGNLRTHDRDAVEPARQIGDGSANLSVRLINVPNHVLPTDNRPLTLRDVSEASGVSEMTVSRVLRNRGDVSAATREKVLTAAKVKQTLEICAPMPATQLNPPAKSAMVAQTCPLG